MASKGLWLNLRSLSTNRDWLLFLLAKEKTGSTNKNLYIWTNLVFSLSIDLLYLCCHFLFANNFINIKGIIKNTRIFINSIIIFKNSHEFCFWAKEGKWSFGFAGKGNENGLHQNKDPLLILRRIPLRGYWGHLRAYLLQLMHQILSTLYWLMPRVLNCPQKFQTFS